MSSLHNYENEIWVPVNGYENKYQVSNFGRIKSIDRYIYRKICKGLALSKGKLLKQSLISDGYPAVTLYGEGGRDKKQIAVHLMVYWSFNKIKSKLAGYEIDHIDNNKQNNKLANLQYIKTRHNSSKRSMNLKKTSSFTGVSWSADRNKWQAHIRLQGRSKNLGRYENEIDASIAYQNALKALP